MQIRVVQYHFAPPPPGLDLITDTLEEFRATGQAEPIPVYRFCRRLTQLGNASAIERAGLVVARESAFLTKPFQSLAIDGVGGLVQFCTHQEFHSGATVQLFIEILVPGLHLLEGSSATGGVQQHQGQGGIMQEELMDQAILLLATHIPQHYIAALSCRGCCVCTQLLWFQRPELHPMCTLDRSLFGWGTGSNPVRQIRLTDITLTYQNNLDAGIEYIRCHGCQGCRKRIRYAIDIDTSIIVTRHHARTIPTESDALKIVCGFQGLQTSQGLQVPKFEGVVSRTRHYPLTVRMNSQRVDKSCMSFNGAQTLTAPQVPQLECLVRRSRHHPLSIRMNSQRVDKSCMSLKGPQTQTAPDVPQLERVVSRTRHDPLTVRMHRYRVDKSCMSLKGPQTQTAPDVPDRKST